MTDKQPDPLALADELERPIGTMTRYAAAHHAAALLRTQHAALERKDALLRRALDALNLHQGAHPETYRQARDAITKELSQ